MNKQAPSRFVIALAMAVVLPCVFWWWSVNAIFTFPWVWEEKLRLASPSGSIDLVEYEGNRGAMSSFRYVYILTNHGEAGDPDSTDRRGVVLICSSSPASLSWKDDRNLKIANDGGAVLYYEQSPVGFDVLVDMPASDAQPEP
jgi:hypothetical protein